MLDPILRKQEQPLTRLTELQVNEMTVCAKKNKAKNPEGAGEGYKKRFTGEVVHFK